MKPAHLISRLCVGLAMLLGCVGAAQAQETTTNPTLASDWMFSAGTAFTHSDPKVGLAPAGRRITLIDLDSLGVDSDDNDFYFHAIWQAPERWRVSFTTFLSKLDGGLFSDKDYQYGELVIPAGSGVSIDMESHFYIFDVDYAVWNRPRWEAGVGFGVYALDWEAGLSLVEGGTGEILGRETGDFLAPLPTLGMFGRYAFSDRLAGRASFDWLSANIGDYDGEVLAVAVGLDWWFTDRWGVSGGFNVVDVDVAVDDEPFNEYVDAYWESLYLKLNLAF